MPRIDLVPEVYQDGEHVYHYHFDNLPLRNIITRQQIINIAVDQQAAILREAKGDANSLYARLNVALEQDGTLKLSAVDETLHNIGSHTDGEYEGVSYVRMTEAERDKLELIADEAKNITITAESTNIDSGEIELVDSTTIEVELVSPRTIKFHTTFGTNSLRLHYYDVEPTPADEDPDYINYKTTEVSTPFVEDSLKIFVNGIRLTESADVLVYGPDGPSEDWVALSYTPDADAGTFELSRAIDSDDIIRIDFDTEVS
jgi:hypothetical protein